MMKDRARLFRASVSSPLPLTVSYGRIHRSLRRRVLCTFTLRFEDLLPSSSGLEAIRVSTFASLRQNRPHPIAGFLLAQFLDGARSSLNSRPSRLSPRRWSTLHLVCIEVGRKNTMVSSGIIPFSTLALDAHGGSGYRPQKVWLGCHKQRTSHAIPIPKRMTNHHIQVALWPTPRAGFSVADPNVIKVSGHRNVPSNLLEIQSDQLVVQRRYSARVRDSLNPCGLTRCLGSLGEMS